MARRLVCCPCVEDGASSLRYLYVDSLDLRVLDVTSELSAFDENLRTVCCFDRLAECLKNRPEDLNVVSAELPFDFKDLHSLEIFRNTEELRLKTGSEKVMFSCLLNYYRREYDGTQQHTFFSDPRHSIVRQSGGSGVEHELTLEERVLVKKEEEEYVPETLDKGKSAAELEMEELRAQLEAELLSAEQEAEDKAKKKDKQDQERKLRNRRNAEQQANGEQLAAQYDKGDFSSLPGYVEPEDFSKTVVPAEEQALYNPGDQSAGYGLSSSDLYSLASRLDEFGVSYTVRSETYEDGAVRHAVCYSQADVQATQAIRFYEMEQNLRAAGAIPSDGYFDANQLRVLDYAYRHDVDTSFVSAESFNAPQMMRVLESGVFRDFRNQDDAQSDRYERFRQYEEEMRAQNADLAAQYDSRNFSSLPGYVAPDDFCNLVAPSDQQAAYYPVDENDRYGLASSDLYALASRLDEFGVPYTVYSEEHEGGIVRHAVCYARNNERAVQATQFYEMEQRLRADGAIPSRIYFNAFQLQALDVAHRNYVDTSFINNGRFNGAQMMRVVEAGACGHDMSIIANPQFSPAQMDAVFYFMERGWDTYDVERPGITSSELASSIIREEGIYKVADGDKFFDHCDFHSFVHYDSGSVRANYLNDYDSAYRTKTYSPDGGVPGSRSSLSVPRLPADASESVYVNHPNPVVRQQAVKLGYGLSTLVNDKDPYVRAEVARRGYALESLVHDKSPVVRLAVADLGYGLNTLVHDSSASVRMAVARKGYGLSELSNDDSWNVRKAARNTINAQQLGSKPNPVLDKVQNSYSWAGTFTPDGRIRTDGSFVPRSSDDFKFRRQGSRTSSDVNVDLNTTRRKNEKPGGTPASESPRASKKHPLDELRVKSGFAERVGLRVEHFGQKTFERGSRLASYSVRTVAGTLIRDDDSGTMPLIYKSVKNVGLVAHVVMDTPRMFVNAGSGVSFTYSAIQQAKNGKPGAARTVTMPLRSDLWRNQIQAAERRYVSYVTRRFGAHAAYLSERDIDQQIAICEKKLAELKEHYLPINRGIKSELKSLETALDLFHKKNALVLENRVLKDEILTLQHKKKRTRADERLLAEKMKKKAANEAAIRSLSEAMPDVKLIKEREALLGKARSLKAEIRDLQWKKNKSRHDHKILDNKIKEKELIERKIQKNKSAIEAKLDSLRKQKKHNEEILRKAGRKGKDLSRLKQIKRNSQKDIKKLEKILGKASAAEGRLKSVPGMLMDGLFSGMHQSGDHALSGIAQASGFAMSFAHNPLVRMALGSVKRIFVKTPEKKAADEAAKKAAAAKKQAAAAKKAEVKTPKKAERRFNKKIRTQDASKIRAQKKDGSLLNRVNRSIRGKAAPKGEDLVVPSKGVKRWMKQTRKKIAEKFAQAAKAVSATVKGVAGGSAAAAGGGTAAAAGGGVLLVVLIIILVIVVFSSMNNASSSFVITPQTDSADSDKIDLTHYIELVNEHQLTLEDEIRAISSGVSSASGEPYDNVFYDYVGKNNTLQIITMAYVRFGFDLAADEEAVEAYIEQLYKDSNFLDSAESEPYSCADGCVERRYYCHQEPDEFATTTRVSLHESLNGTVGCTAQLVSCMEPGHSIYNQYGCYQHNGGALMDAPGDCDHYSTSDSGYYCLGHCPGDHTEYTCPGHTETVCYGKHQDLVITITSLDFDDIFYADSSLASTGSTVRGEALGQFVISAYCSCHECCHPYDPECTGKPSQTASGTTPKAKHTLAVDAYNPVVPLGTHVWIDGVEYVVEDTGDLAKHGRDFDMYFEDHNEANRWGVRTKTVYKGVEVVEETLPEGEGGTSATETKDPYGFDGWTEDNIEVTKHIYDVMKSEEGKEVYLGLDGVVQLSYGGYTGDYDFSELVYSEVDPNTLTTLQKAVLDVIESNRVPTRKDMCQAWVANVYEAAGANGDSRCCAGHAGESWGTSTNWADIQIGAAVYGYSSSKYGHVGIYIGNGQVAHNIGYLKIESLESWVKAYNGVCWGWNGGHNLSGNAAYNCKPAGTFMHGRC